MDASQEAELASLGDRRGAVAHPQFAVDLVEMPLGGPDGDRQLLGDFTIGEPATQMSNDLDLGLAQDLALRHGSLLSS